MHHLIDAEDVIYEQPKVYPWDALASSLAMYVGPASDDAADEWMKNPPMDVQQAKHVLCVAVDASLRANK